MADLANGRPPRKLVVDPTAVADMATERLREFVEEITEQLVDSSDEDQEAFKQVARAELAVVRGQLVRAVELDCRELGLVRAPAPPFPR